MSDAILVNTSSGWDNLSVVWKINIQNCYLFFFPEERKCYIL